MKKSVALASLLLFSTVNTTSLYTTIPNNDTNLKAHKKYAILMTGGNEGDLYEKSEEAYSRLKNFGLEDDDIEYLASNKKEAAKYGLDDEVDSGNSWQDLKNAFDKIDKKSTKDDVILIFYIGHGMKIKSNSKYYTNKTMLTNALTEGDLEGKLKNLEYKTAVVFIDSCYSGAFTKAAKDNTIVITSCKEKEKSFIYSNIVPLFLKALTKKKTSKRADSNKDGKVTVKEAFTYAVRKDFWSSAEPKTAFPKPQIGYDKTDPEDVYVKY